ncbi:prostate androgen-regulated mucin-like protein 1 [Delphinus delphis]|uniref:prostate androgen-regulated mucin-like protein 1 n=1 Tax=Delphinus delphis TaxID=9728 RepID=UPI0028C4D777|nr:prostate androgen-regulated mucin-like protein 1 [Delphinus delphis]
MVYKTLFALCIFTAGLRLQSASESALSPVSLPAKSSPPTAFSPQSPPASPTGGTPSSSVLPDTASARTSPSAKNVSTEPREEEPTSPASNWEGTDTAASPTSGGVHLTPTLEEHTSDTPEAGAAATGSQPPVESPALTSPQAPASSPSPPSTSPPEEVPSAPVSTNRNSAEASTKPTGALTTSEPPAEEHISGHVATSHAPAEPVPTGTTAQATVPPRVTCMLIDTETTTAPPGVIMQEVEHALSSGSIAAITVTVIAVVLLVFGVAAYLKIRHSSYGRLLDDHDYGSWGNYNNPLYDDS